MFKRNITLALLTMTFSTLAFGAVTIASPKLNAVVPDSITMSGTCASGTQVKANVRDEVNVFSPTVIAACTKSKYSVTVNSAKLQPGRLKLKAYQGSVAAYLFVKKEAPVITQPTPTPTPGQPRPQRMVKIMPLGDSITHGYTVLGGYRTKLYQLLYGPNFYDHFDLVGTENDGPANLPDKDHQGHPGFRIDQIDQYIDIGMDISMPDMVLLHIGSNDILQNYSVSSAPTRTMGLIDKIRAKNPNVIIIVAKIFPANDAALNAKIGTYNTNLTNLVKAREASGQKVHIVDMNTGFNAAVDTSDSVHPTQTAYNAMADRWFAAILAYQNP